ncbi:hypothetical protein CCAX7_007830 [Capsulimonas corticalis]|uniref:O-antigen ligase-related domain-containing protein n=1 Tax=Capsulimonas corticalis TaxID=2219043 RepID=A0A402D1R6_9BACT|nr:O-antigen ligase family protein [Capsulimonas corticalis]BDI28732.1 hypothetical protein CCAX7_007830 [Capsulimonas corticalis]
MIQTPKVSFHDAPTADEYLAANKRRMRRLLLGAALLALAVGGSYVGVSLGNPALPLVLLVAIVTPVLLWRYPALATYTVFLIVCTSELQPITPKDSFTDKLMFFMNINTIVQVYAHANFKALPISLMELFLLVAGVISMIRAVFTRSTKLEAGKLFLPIVIYIGFVTLGWAHGVGTGGDFKISLQEVRSQFYFLVAYLLAVNVITDMRRVTKLQWIMVLCIGLKGILYTFRRYVTMAGLPLPDQGVGSHEEAFFFDCFEALLLVLTVAGIQPKMRTVMWILLPTVILGNLACNRRAATAAIAIAVILVIAAAYQALPERRKMAGIVAVALAIGFSIYYPAFKDSSSLIGQPARAIKSQFAPDARDASSNNYRDAENADILATVKLEPVLGYGYGKRMLHAVPIADISKSYEWWDILPHNNVLWVWMRVGTLGFIAFWAMIAAIIFQACAVMRIDKSDNSVKAVGMISLLFTGMLLVFGLLDLQLSNFRDMLLTGFWTGVATAVLRMQQRPSASAPPEALSQ